MITDPNKIRVAIVDDEELARERMRALLSEHSDIEVVAECADGAEALRAIDDKNPDLVFLDVQMPDVDGFDVIEATRTNGKSSSTVCSIGLSMPISGR